jgi:hypothetical protein
MPWLDADKKYALGIDDGKLVCRNPAGKKLASVPKELSRAEELHRLAVLGLNVISGVREIRNRAISADPLQLAD